MSNVCLHFVQSPISYFITLSIVSEPTTFSKTSFASFLESLVLEI